MQHLDRPRGRDRLGSRERLPLPERRPSPRGWLAWVLATLVGVVGLPSGLAWAQFEDPSAGLLRRDVVRVVFDDDGQGWALTHGIVYRSEAGAYRWRPVLWLQGVGPEATSDEAASDEPDLDLDEAQVDRRAEALDAYEDALQTRVEELLDEAVENLRDELSEIYGDNIVFVEELIDELMEELYEDALEAALAELGEAPEEEVAQVVATTEADWEQAEREELPRERYLALHAMPQAPIVYIGSTAGLQRVVTQFNGVVVEDVALSEGNAPIVSIASLGEERFAASADTLFTWGPGDLHATALASYRAASPIVSLATCGDRLWVAETARVVVLARADGTAWQVIERSYPPGVSEDNPLRHMACSRSPQRPVWVATAQGVVYWSSDAGDWMTASGLGLPSPDVHMLVESEGTLWAATGAGAARWERGRWVADVETAGSRVRWLAPTVHASLLAATRDGLMEIVSRDALAERAVVLGNLHALWEREPDFPALLRAAYEHAGLAGHRPVGWSREQRWGGVLFPAAARVEGRYAERVQDRMDRRDSFPGGALAWTYFDRRESGYHVTAWLVWDLGRPLSVQHDLLLANTERRLHVQERLLYARVNRLWRQRRQVMVAMQSAGGATRTKARSAIRYLKLTADLHALTGYRFPVFEETLPGGRP